MNTQIKVEKTKTYEDELAHEDVLVAEAKLVLIECNLDEALLFKWWGSEGDEHLCLSSLNQVIRNSVKFYKPILISETEKIEVGAIAYGPTNQKEQLIYQLKEGEAALFPDRKILALLEQFSPEQLQMIIDGKLKEGDKVLIECETYSDRIESNGNKELWRQIKLNSSNHITLYPIEKKLYTREEAYNILLTYNKSLPSFSTKHTIADLQDWFQQNIK